ncbi:MAG TPA: hypothetical protein VMD92_11060 [Acidobacteriaceae bacterium]|nr:hypothetical protein [Acidobacteriaceae bacterium]
MARCPRCLQPVDDDRKCLDTECGYRMKRDSLRPFWTIFTLVGMAHLALLFEIGVPTVEPPVPLGFWLFVAVCWLFVNTLAAVVLYVPYVFAYELHPDEYAAWLQSAKRAVRATIWSAGPGAARGGTEPKSSSSRG